MPQVVVDTSVAQLLVVVLPGKQVAVLLLLALALAAALFEQREPRSFLRTTLRGGLHLWHAPAYPFVAPRGCSAYPRCHHPTEQR